MAPFNMRCVTCGEYIYKGKKFNARKEDVENETYLGIRIYRFYIKCTRCLQEISFKTDPQATDYVIEAGATRNFMALKLAEEQAKREEDEEREEEANNPMKLLEKRTEQSRNEIELLGALEELKDLNRRHQNIDYEGMLQQFNEKETPEEREARLAKMDEEYIKTIKFGSSSSGPSASGTKRVVVEEEILEEDTPTSGANSTTQATAPAPEKKVKLIVAPKGQISFLSKLKMQNLVKKKEVTTQSVMPQKDSAPVNAVGGLSLLAAYSDNSDDSEWSTDLYVINWKKFYNYSKLVFIN